MLADPPAASIDELQSRAGPAVAGRTPADIRVVLDTLVGEGLVAPTPRVVRIN